MAWKHILKHVAKSKALQKYKSLQLIEGLVISKASEHQFEQAQMAYVPSSMTSSSETIPSLSSFLVDILCIKLAGYYYNLENFIRNFFCLLQQDHMALEDRAMSSYG